MVIENAVFERTFQELEKPLRITCQDFNHENLVQKALHPPIIKRHCGAMLIQWKSRNFLVLKKIPGQFVLKKHTRESSKLQKDTLKKQGKRSLQVI